MDFKKYPSYKDSGVEWLGGVPEHWDVKRLKYLFSIKNGATPKSNVSQFWDGDIKWVTPSDLSKLESHEIAESSRTITVEGFNSCGTNLVPAGSIIVSCRAPIGSLAITLTSLCTNQGCKSLVASKILNIKFYFYFLSISADKLNSLGNGTTFLELSSFELKNLSILAPRLEEQTQIVSFLDSETSRIDNLIAKQEKLIEKLEEHRKSVISHAVTKGLDPNVPMKDSGVKWLGEVPEHWKVSSLKRICEVKDGTHDTPSYIEFSESAFPLVTSKNLKKTGLTLNHCKYISKLDYENIIKRSNVKKNDILMPMIGTVGGAVIVNTDEPFAIKNVALFKNNNKICNKWLCYVLNSSLIDIQFLLFKNGGVQDFIGLNDLRNLIVPNIPLSQQKLITNYLDKQVYKIDHSIDKQRELIEKLKNYRTSIISHAVTGKIDVRDLVA